MALHLEANGGALHQLMRLCLAVEELQPRFTSVPNWPVPPSHAAITRPFHLQRYTSQTPRNMLSGAWASYIRIPCKPFILRCSATVDSSRTFFQAKSGSSPSRITYGILLGETQRLAHSLL
ncbi:hypothetical protein PISMIDRAFT_681589 [Pisolithus microcarpus 441]|uniref:Uncharacterized protein n=1 Tax=Pisolithus microcarpus 441 TaxID=765257 RepID=A0A0C9Y924_9AGAM|nr:hypothetical protein PISMIDRAFT_681589 [Pisolithus microcarpus 441]